MTATFTRPHWPFRGVTAHQRRLAWALAASSLLHAWLALELPADSARPRPSASAFTARLVPAVNEGPVVVPPKGEPRAVAREASTRTEAQPRNSGKLSTHPVNRDAGAGTQRTETRPLAAPDDATYYPARDLDVYPVLLSPLALEYPERARPEEKRGRVLVMLLIDAAGRVDDIAVVEAEPPGYFEEAARKAFEQARFSGARRNGMPVKSRVLINVDFDSRAANRPRP